MIEREISVALGVTSFAPGTRYSERRSQMAIGVLYTDFVGGIS
jgi:hypothetical protein